MNDPNENLDIILKKDENYPGIYRLNNDCLRHIFQYLPIVDRIRIERVCKRWQLVSKESWNDFKELHFENEFWGFNRESTIDKINLRIFKKILHRCGKYLVDIDFIESNKRLGPNVMNTLAKYCPNIQYIYANDLIISPWSIRALSNSCNKLIFFSLGDTTEECDDELALLFASNRQLKHLCVSSNFEVTGKCLLNLNSESIESIVFENCPAICLKYFSIVKNFTNLNELMIEHFHDSNTQTLKDIGCCKTNLKTLSLALCPFYTNSLSYIARLSNLESLDLSSNVSVDDSLLMEIGANCRLLKRVDISYCNLVTNIGLASIITLPYLQDLYIEDLENITDQVFNRRMPNLRDMDCSYCSNIKDAGLASLIESSDRIEHLYLNNCQNISNELLEAAIKATKKRKNNVVLKMYLSQTNIKFSNVNDTSPFLQVIPLITVNFVK